MRTCLLVALSCAMLLFGSDSNSPGDAAPALPAR